MGNLSELQISLIGIGIVVVLGVMVFNWTQQRRYRRKAEQAFSREHEDILLGAGVSAKGEERIEPRLSTGAEPHEPEAEPGTHSSASPEVSEPAQKANVHPALHPPSRPKAGKAVERTRFKGPASFTVPARRSVDEDSRREGAVVHERFSIPVAAASDEERSVEGDSVSDAVDYVVEIARETPFADLTLADVLDRKSDFSKPVRWMGKQEADASWEEIPADRRSREGKASYVNLKGCLQLADRAGPVSEVSLGEFRDMAKSFAARVNATAHCPDIHKSYSRALMLDEFCTQVDVMAGINIISRDNSVFTGAKIRVMAEACGFKLGDEGMFHYRDENNVVLFSLGNYEPPPFLPDSIRTLTTRGITLFLDVPRVANGERVFNQMVHLAETFSEALGGFMVDDNRVPLSDSGIRKIKQQLSSIQSVMMARNIPPGGQIALRLFG
ncbi:cell division protein ZipA C-terminal FtsZ-binding domain-containing protein [Nitrosospira multiformis]|uniref:Cell division protein ZipA n=1 Tax=Nitrosospira multiformis TaxID=1231 RepID=A0A1I7F6D2_9PROT|nr:cell division protein ZipA C-terminal FtsZ-binding domain-containing protein [Nitrosospira multiformis]SFU31751.1 ZipA, C-terminal FtsZ-binding domain [Nitrosospira multiformis]